MSKTLKILLFIGSILLIIGVSIYFISDIRQVFYITEIFPLALKRALFVLVLKSFLLYFNAYFLAIACLIMLLKSIKKQN